MAELNIQEIKKNVVAIGRLLWEKGLASALNGNISARVDSQNIVLTATRTCLGLLQEKDVLNRSLTGKVLEEGEISTERPLHMEIYRNFPDVSAVIHTHTVFTNAYFLENNVFTSRVFESRLWFGELTAVEQFTPTVTDAAPVIAALRKNNLAVLRNHGVVAMGKDLFTCFLLIQTLEEALQTEAMSRVFRPPQKTPAEKRQPVAKTIGKKIKKYKLFSKEQIDQIVKLVNADAALKDLGKKTQMTMSLAVKSDNSGKVYNFYFTDGRISRVTTDEQAEFLLTAPDKVWRAVFNREIDPFVATTQKKIVLKGDFARLSKWYGAFQRVFALWQEVPVE